MLKVNGVDVSHCKGFAYDGCHKIYLVETDADIQEATRLGYMPLHTMDELEKTFVESCPLRFIHWWDLNKPSVVPQCATSVAFEDNNGTREYNFKEL